MGLLALPAVAAPAVAPQLVFLQGSRVLSASLDAPACGRW